MIETRKNQILTSTSTLCILIVIIVFSASWTTCSSFTFTSQPVWGAANLQQHCRFSPTNVDFDVDSLLSNCDNRVQRELDDLIKLYICFATCLGRRHPATNSLKICQILSANADFGHDYGFFLRGSRAAALSSLKAPFRTFRTIADARKCDALEDFAGTIA